MIRDTYSLPTPLLEHYHFSRIINPYAISVGSFFSTLDMPDFRASRRGPCHTLFETILTFKMGSKSVKFILQTLGTSKYTVFLESWTLGRVNVYR